jgi:hypothetical protein
VLRKTPITGCPRTARVLEAAAVLPVEDPELVEVVPVVGMAPGETEVEPPAAGDAALSAEAAGLAPPVEALLTVSAELRSKAPRAS